MKQLIQEANIENKMKWICAVTRGPDVEFGKCYVVDKYSVRALWKKEVGKIKTMKSENVYLQVNI